MRVHAVSVHYSSVRGDWETPHDLFAQFDAEFHFTLDVCATRTNAKCVEFIPPEWNGLEQNWGRHVCWMNPPYGREIGAWMQKALISSIYGATVVCLVPSRTDTRWWHNYAMKADERRFLKGRVRFVGAKSSAPFPSAIVIFRPQALESAA